LAVFAISNELLVAPAVPAISTFISPGLKSELIFITSSPVTVITPTVLVDAVVTGKVTVRESATKFTASSGTITLVELTVGALAQVIPSGKVKVTVLLLAFNAPFTTSVIVNLAMLLLLEPIPCVGTDSPSARTVLLIVPPSTILANVKLIGVKVCPLTVPLKTATKSPNWL
jgi:hypothetical protein